MSQENNVVMNNVVIDGYHAQVRTSLMESSGIHEACKYLILYNYINK